MQYRSRAEIFGISIFILLAVVWLGSISLELLHKSSIARASETEKTDQSEPSEIVVHIEGAVNNPGLIKIPVGSRIDDVLKLAGGTLEDADTSLLNLAESVEDGQKIYIPKKGEVPAVPIVTGTDSSTEQVDQSKMFPLNLNTATKDELMMLPGIGDKRAQDIIDYRTRRGGFKKKTDLMNISGIGEVTYDKIKDLVYI